MVCHGAQIFGWCFAETLHPRLLGQDVPPRLGWTIL